MSDDENISERKLEHVRGALAQYAAHRENPFDAYAVRHEALPEIDLAAVDASTEFLGKKIAAPLMIASITGGTEQAGAINRRLAAAARECGVPLALGSAKIVFKHPETFATFDVRDICPGVPLLANLGLVDLGRAFTPADCVRLVERLRADALIFHLNPLHEALQPNGATDFTGRLETLRSFVADAPFPVIVKEVGHGIGAETCRRLSACGVHAVDIAGSGGTSWGFIEGARAADPVRKAFCDTFSTWGIPTPAILEELKNAEISAQIIASGGVWNGVDAFKCLCLGADIAAAAGPFLKLALTDETATVDAVRRMTTEFRLAMFASGCKKLSDIHSDLIFKR